MQESSCQHNIHYYSDKNRVAFTSISRRQHYSLLQNSIKNRRSRVNCHLAAESHNCLPLLQIDQVWSRGGNGLSLWWGSQGSEQAVAPSTQKSLGVEPKKSGWSRFQHLPLEVIGSDGLQGLGGFFLSQILLAVLSVATGYPAKLSKSTESSGLDYLNISISQQTLLQVTGAAASSGVNFSVYPALTTSKCWTANMWSIITPLMLLV